jgi:hypothetical protein
MVKKGDLVDQEKTLDARSHVWYKEGAMNTDTQERIRTTLVIETSLHYQVRMEAAHDNTDMSTVVERALREYYERKNGSKGKKS